MLATAVRTVVLMDTFVTIKVVDHDATGPVSAVAAAMDQAFEWFRLVEACCSRFASESELSRLSGHTGMAVPVSAMLYEAVQFALAVAEESGGAFDPTVGREMETRGFNREYTTGQVVRTVTESPSLVSYRNVHLDPQQRTIRCDRPLTLDLGAVAKGLAIDMAAQELRAFPGFAIDAGGDLYLGGLSAGGGAWKVGIRHPRRDGLLASLRVSNMAVCTSGDYERVKGGDSSSDHVAHHIVDPREDARSGARADTRLAASVTVVAPTAMLADALATAAFVLGPADGLQLLEHHGVDGLIVSPTLERHATRGMFSDYDLGIDEGATGEQDGKVLQDAEGPADRHPGRASRARRTG
ncbi:MAG: FAD:protein FMN transferase [Acidobacteriota bacterium]